MEQQKKNKEQQKKLEEARKIAAQKGPLSKQLFCINVNFFNLFSKKFQIQNFKAGLKKK